MAEKYYDDGRCVIYHGDCREVLPTLAPVDLLLTDPPYGIPKGAAVWRRNGTAIEDWGDELHNVSVDGWHALVALAEDAWIVEFGLRAGDPRLLAEHVAAGWTPCNFYAFVKSAPAPTTRPMFANSLELAVVSRRGAPRWHGSGYVPNRWIGMSPNQAGTDRGHPTEKPTAMLTRIADALTADGDTVLDPFAGSGTTLRAAKDLGRRAIGIEISERYCEIAARRLDQGVLDFGDGNASGNLANRHNETLWLSPHCLNTTHAQIDLFGDTP